MLRGVARRVGYPPHSPVAPSLPLPPVAVCHVILIVLYLPLYGLTPDLPLADFDGGHFVDKLLSTSSVSNVVLLIKRQKLLMKCCLSLCTGRLIKRRRESKDRMKQSYRQARDVSVLKCSDV
jgi:hypothetical protein